MGVGLLGVILPVLPTTPFLLLTAFLLAKSDSKYNDWFVNTKVYNKYLKEFHENKAMTNKQKWSLMIFTDLVIMISFISVEILVIRVMLVILAVIKHLYFHKYVTVIHQRG